ncbi:MAG: hypothetical protein DRJ10_04195 [Bacteroidetes bacterium]|nr:MAG: hypothetical protein DRJ10_04195 [Bacteroidota bacterium]
MEKTKEKKYSNYTKGLLRIVRSLKKITFIFSTSILIIIIGSWIYFYYTYDGNLLFYVSNQSITDSVDICVELDGEIIIDSTFSNSNYHKKEFYSFSVYPGAHYVVIKSKNNKTILINEFNAFFINWIVVDFYDHNHAKKYENIESPFFALRYCLLPPAFQ